MECNMFEDSYLVGVAIRIGRFSVQSPLGARLGSGTQPRYDAPGDHPVKIVKTLSNIG